jgi:hypothetical protein
MRLTLPSLAATFVLALAGAASAQTVGVGASVDCDPVGVGNYRSAIVKEVPPGGREVIVDLDDFTPNGKFVTCPLAKLRVVPREAFTKGPPGEYGVFHSGDRVECSTGGATTPGKIVTLVDPRGVYQVLLDGNDPAEKPVTCETAQLKRYSGLPEGGRGFKR